MHSWPKWWLRRRPVLKSVVRPLRLTTQLLRVTHLDSGPSTVALTLLAALLVEVRVEGPPPPAPAPAPPASVDARKETDGFRLLDARVLNCRAEPGRLRMLPARAGRFALGCPGVRTTTMASLLLSAGVACGAFGGFPSFGGLLKAPKSSAGTGTPRRVVGLRGGVAATTLSACEEAAMVVLALCRC